MTKNAEALVKHNGANLHSAAGETWARAITPAADVYETADAYVVLLDLPGAAKESISLTLDHGTLVVTAPAGRHHGPDGALLYREIRAGNYHRAFTIGEGVDGSKIDARYQDGVLAVKLFKSESMKPREILIQ